MPHHHRPSQSVSHTREVSTRHLKFEYYVLIVGILDGVRNAKWHTYGQQESTKGVDSGGEEKTRKYPSQAPASWETQPSEVCRERTGYPSPNLEGVAAHCTNERLRYDKLCLGSAGPHHSLFSDTLLHSVHS